MREVADEDNSCMRLRILEEAMSSFAFPETTVNIPGSEYLALLDKYDVVNCQVYVDWTRPALDQFIQQYIHGFSQCRQEPLGCALSEVVLLFCGTYPAVYQN